MAQSEAGAAAADEPRGRSPARLLTAVILLLGAALTAALAVAATASNNDNENRLVRLQVHQAAATLSTALPSLQAPLIALYELGTVPPGGVARFDFFAAQDLVPKGSFASISLWHTGPAPQMLAHVGSEPLLARSPAVAAAFWAGVHPSATVMVTPILGTSAARRLGYAEVPPGATTGLAVYAETALPANRKLSVARSSPFADLNYALYLGTGAQPANLLATSIPLPIKGRQAATTVPFGNTTLLVIGAPIGQIGDNVAAELPWIIIGAGLLITLSSALVAEYLIRRRREAEALAAENRQLYRDQRAVALTLQHALLPDVLPDITDLEVAVRYVPGTSGLEIGGDWYDVIAIDDHCCVFVVGDVSGRGLEAATTMASLRFAIHAYAQQGDRPEVILDKLSEMLNIGKGGQFATVLCGYIELSKRRMSLASAGHPWPLVREGSSAAFVTASVGPPIGIRGTRPPAVEVDLPADGTLVAFTDGLVERRGESLDEGLGRLRAAVLESDGSIEEVLDHVISRLTPEGSSDDVALLGLRWRS